MVILESVQVYTNWFKVNHPYGLRKKCLSCGERIADHCDMDYCDGCKCETKKCNALALDSGYCRECEDYNGESA